MSLLMTERVINGDSFSLINIYKCDECKQKIPEYYPHVEIPNERHLCIECGFKNGLISEKEYLEDCGISINKAHVVVRNNEVVIWVGNQAPWERPIQYLRKTAAYSEWRKAVFERDQYTCQICGQVGGKLNAHHVKSFAKFPKLRLKISNGLTLCENCHRNIHRKR
ncbi:HNH endonuclease [Paucilactobacillus kaifaensis]|uniref:HNH endonuclease n=1 Tax=Paucilactobacillus kaifaensis TaxID=2559921 RepID=UPI0010F8AB4A|nr:HNH endonuclease [Paucilactobacillus kaifaensis]